MVACPTPSIVLYPVSWGYCVHVRGAILLITSQGIIKMILKVTFYGRKTTQCCFRCSSNNLTACVVSVSFSFSGKLNHTCVNTPDNFALVFSYRCTSPAPPHLFSQIPPGTLTTPLFQSAEFLPLISYPAQRRSAHFKGPVCNTYRDLSA